MSFEDKVDEAAQRLAIESRSLLGVPKDPEGCRDRWIRRLPHPPEALNFARHVWRHVPVLVENCIQDRPCWYKWHSSEYMIKAMGQRHVQVALTPNGRADDIHLHEGRDVFVLPQETQMTFDELFKTLRHTANGQRPEAIAYLQSQNSNLTATDEDGSGDLSPLLKDILPAEEGRGTNAAKVSASGSYTWADEALGCEPQAANLWIGTEKSRTSMHRDHYENLFSVLRGTKTFTLYPPCEAHFLCEEEPYDVFQWTCKPDGSWDLRPSDSPPTPWIPIDPTEPATSVRNSRFPRFAKALPPLVVEVHEGQTLYLPAGWFHHVAQRGDAEGLCICVNWWYESEVAFGDRWALETFVKEVGQIARGKDPVL